MRRLYSALVTLIAPVAFAVVLLRGLRDRAYWAHLRERFGLGGVAGARPGIWLHAVSLGEVSAAAALVRGLRARHPDMPFVISTSTPTGRAQALALFAGDKGIDVRYLPYDTPGSVERFLRRVRPQAAVIMETELWPNLLHACRGRGVPIMLANARLTPRSVARYRRLGRLFREAVESIALIAAQTREDADRFVAVGAPSARTKVIGNVKFDFEQADALREQGRELRSRCLGARPVWIAGSTHEGEEAAALDAHAQLTLKFADALLMLVPRHPQRFDNVAHLLAGRGIPYERRSAGRAVRPQARVLLIDSVGELAMLYAAADAAFVGGSLVPIGGHNLLEPAALGIPVITGPHHENAPAIAQALLRAGAAVEVADAAGLAGVLGKFFQDPDLRRQTGERAQAFVDRHRGSVERLLVLFERMLGDSRAG